MCRHSITRPEESSKSTSRSRATNGGIDFGQPSPRWTSPIGAGEASLQLACVARAVRLVPSYLGELGIYQDLAEAPLVHRLDCRLSAEPGWYRVRNAKESTILGVGRFVPDKKADILVEAFRALCDRGLEGWRLVLAGGLDTEWEGAVPYVEGLKQRAEGYPIDLRMDVPGPELRKLFQTAAIFWHAKGYGVDPDVNPEHMEHFGIVVVEAMAAGCVPFIFAGGGQQEIVRHGIDGFHWGDPRELSDRTWELIHAPEASRRDVRRIGSASRGVNKQAFVKSFREALADLLPSGDTLPRTAGLGERR